MNWDWLWLLWPLAGFLAWGWLGHTAYHLKDNHLTSADKVSGMLFCMAVGFGAVAIACIEAAERPSKDRWRLRFW